MDKQPGEGRQNAPCRAIPFACIRTPLHDHAPVPNGLHRASTPPQLTPSWSVRLRGDGGALGTLGGTGLESVAELAVDGLEVSHAAGTGGLSSLGLLAPVVCRVLISCWIRYARVPRCQVDVHLRVLAAG